MDKKVNNNIVDNETNKKEFKLLDPKNYVVFQMLFSNNDITKGLVSNILKEKMISVKTNVNKQLLGNNTDDKVGIVDLRAIINDNIECEIEMQMLYFKNFIPRFLHYCSRLYSSQLKEGEDYDLLHKTISIDIINQNVPRLKGLPAHTAWKIREAENYGEILTDKLELHIIEVQKAIEEYKNNKTDELLQWIMFLENPESKEVNNIMVRNKEIRSAKDELVYLSQDEENQRIAEFRKKELMDKKDIYETGWDEGREEGKVEGKAELKKEIIINLLKMKMPIDKIEEATNTTKEEIEKIKKEENL